MNKDPSPSTRFKPGNPGRPRKDARPPQEASPQPSPVEPPRSIDELVIAKLRAIVETEEDAGHVIRAARILVSEDLAAAIRAMERDRTEDESRRQRIKTAAALVLEHRPEVAPELAERFVRRCLEATEPRTLTELLEDRLGFWESEPLTDETLTQIWHELGLPGDPGPTRPYGCPTRPRCGLVELPDPDAEFLHAREVERERERRARIKHPGQVTPPPLVKVEPEPPEPPPDEPPEPETSRPYISFPGFDFYPQE